MNDSSNASPKSDPDLRPGKLAAKRWRIVAVALILLVVGGLIFSDFVFGAKLLLYKESGGDSVNETYPILIHLSDYIRAHGLPSWSFSVGMGQSIYYLIGDLILEPVVWLPRHLIAPSLVYLHLAKTLIVGLLFWAFLRFRGVCLPASIAGALGLAFSADMSMGACWVTSADETLCFTFVLFAAELAIVSGRWSLLPIAVALSGMVTVFHLYLCAVLLCAYVPARLIERGGWKSGTVWSLSWRLAIYAVLGVGIGAVVFFGSAYVLLNTPRGSAIVGKFAFGAQSHVFELGTPLYYITAVLRQFAADIAGTGDAYIGWRNYYEGPLSYCTLAAFLLSPQAFVGATRRQRILYGSFLCLIAVPVVFPWFRSLFWLFRGDYFRTFSLFTIFVLLVLSTTAFSRYAVSRTLNLWVLAVTLLGLLMLLHLPIPQIQQIVNNRLKWPVTVFLVVYALLLVIGQRAKRENIATWAIVALSAIELVWFDRITVNGPTLLKSELSQRIGYNDLTVDVIKDIKSSDAGFFRITKTWGSSLSNHPSFNDAMVFGYYSTPSYSSFNNINYINFLVTVGAIGPENVATDSQWSLGLMWQSVLLAFACEKYAITFETKLFDQAKQYELIHQYGNIHVYRNTTFVPFGLVFDQYIPSYVFLRMSESMKSEALLRAVVLDETNVARNNELSPLSMDELESRINHVPLEDVIARDRSTALQIESFDETRIAGKVQLESTSILVFQMPFDRGWHAFTNGQPAPVIKVDAGLTGVILKRGQHDLELKYRQPFLVSGALISLISLLAFAVAVRKWPNVPIIAPS